MHEVQEKGVDIAPDFVQTFFKFIDSLIDSSDATSTTANLNEVKEVAVPEIPKSVEVSSATVECYTNASPAPLPPGWSEQVSQSSDPGKTYYVNEGTGETTWDRPSAAESPKPVHKGTPVVDSAEPPLATPTGLPSGWSEHVSQSSDPGKKYYVNDGTGETTWDRPSPKPDHKEGTPIDSAAPTLATPTGLPSGWSEHVSQSSEPGKKYYVHEGTGETTWDRPGGDEPSSVKEPIAIENAAPAGWTAHTSQSSDPGKTYYVNDSTGETTWTKPTVIDKWVKKTSQQVQPGKDYYENTTTGSTRWAPPLMASNDDECNRCKKKGKMPHTSFFVKNNRAQKCCFCSIECFEKTEF